MKISLRGNCSHACVMYTCSLHPCQSKIIYVVLTLKEFIYRPFSNYFGEMNQCCYIWFQWNTCYFHLNFTLQCATVTHLQAQQELGQSQTCSMDRTLCLRWPEWSPRPHPPPPSHTPLPLSRHWKQWNHRWAEVNLWRASCSLFYFINYYINFLR